MRTRFFVWLCLLLSWLSFAAGVRAQAEHYEPIDIPGDREKVLRQRLSRAQRLDQLINQIRQAANLKWGPEKLTNLAKENKEAMEQLTSKLKESGKLPPALLKKLVKEMGKASVEPGNVLGSEQKQPAGMTSPGLPTPNFPPEAAPDELQERMNRWALDFLKNAEESQIGDMMQHSPAWTNAISQMQAFVNQRGLRAPSWTDRLAGFAPKSLDLPAMQSAWEKLRGMKLPSLPRVGLALPQINASVPVARLPRAGIWGSAQILIWTVAASCVLVILWQMRKRGGRRRLAAEGSQLGPWPVNPGHIATSTELIAAFEYLSLLLLGRRARTWNHRTIADGLAGTATGADGNAAAWKLAALYEQARYAPGDATLSPAALDQARRHLCLLAGVAQP